MTGRNLPFAAALPLLVALISLAGCQPWPDLQGPAATEIASLPQLQGTVLLDEQRQTRGGADDECYLGIAINLYGTDLSGQQVMDFYREYFTRRGWTEYYDGAGRDSTNASHLGMKAPALDYAFAVSVLKYRQSSVESYDEYEMRPGIVDDAFRQYDTVYVINLNYAEPWRRERCGY